MMNVDDPNLFVLQTPYHIMLACEKHEKKDYIICIGNIVEQKDIKKMVDCCFDKDHVIVTKDINYYKKNKIELFRFKSIVSTDIKCISRIRFNNLFVFNDTDPVVQWIENKMTHNNVVLIEEGIGTYRDVVKRQKLFFKCFGKLFFGTHFEDIYRMGTTKPVTMIECSKPERLNEIQREKIIIHQNEIDFTALAESIGIKRISSKNWFLGQPLVEDGVLKKDEYLSQIERILACTEGNIIIKPHPRENLEKYSGLNVIRDNSIPIELLVDNSCTSNIYTIYSSAVLNLSRFKNIKCFAFCNTKKANLIDSEIIRLFEENGITVVL